MNSNVNIESDKRPRAHPLLGGVNGAYNGEVPVDHTVLWRI